MKSQKAAAIATIGAIVFATLATVSLFAASSSHSEFGMNQKQTIREIPFEEHPTSLHSNAQHWTINAKNRITKNQLNKISEPEPQALGAPIYADRKIASHD